MSNIVEKIKNIKDLGAIKGCSMEQVNEAQKALGIIFPDEYIDYVTAFGCIDFGATEWTGLNINGRLNTVEATKKEMSVNKDFPKDCFVLEETGIDARQIIVNEKGEVFMLQHDRITPICKSISEYLDVCVARNGHL